MEFLLHGLAEYSQIGKKEIRDGISFNDVLGNYFRLEYTDDDSDVGANFDSRFN
jgi:magnesium chelatase subunit I